jgi:hypothetical protein
VNTTAIAERTTTPGSDTPALAPPVAGAWGVPWYIWAVAFASTSVVVGGIWDISWHRTIGRDTFWTSAHMAIYLGGAAAGLSCGWLVLRTTFAELAAGDRAAGVTFWGFRGPLGAWVCIWGSFAMIASGPFDDWWHNTYGLDVEILSPPHTVLAAGIMAIQVGAMLMVLSRQNNSGAHSQLARLLFLYAGGVLIVSMATVAIEYVGFPNDHRNAPFYLVSAGIFPLFLVGISRASLSRWGATGAAAAYMALSVLMMWILQLFSAEPLLGPILRPVDSMVAPPFPLLLVVPALAIDLLIRRLPAQASRLSPWILSCAIGVGFVAVLLTVQWYFSAFLLGEGARNLVFGADQWDYNSLPGPWQYEYWGTTVQASQLAWAALIAFVSARVGLWWGGWMSRVRR